MDNELIQLQLQTQTQTENEVYLKIWDSEQAYQRHRWTIVTFFIGISFAIIGISFQAKITFLSLLAMRIMGVSIYWFAYGLYIYFYGYTKALRTYLLEMEKSGRVLFNLQSRIITLHKKSILHKIMSAGKFLLFCGITITLLIVLISLKDF